MATIYSRLQGFQPSQECMWTDQTILSSGFFLLSIMCTVASLGFICDLGSQHALVRIKSTCIRSSNIDTEFSSNTYWNKWHKQYKNLWATSYLGDHKQGIYVMYEYEYDALTGIGSQLTAHRRHFGGWARQVQVGLRRLLSRHAPYR
jgi:hypothetical protein